MWAFFLTSYFTLIKDQLMVLLMKKTSLNKLDELQLSLNKLAINRDDF